LTRPTVFLAADPFGRRVLKRVRQSFPDNAQGLAYLTDPSSTTLDRELEEVLKELLLAGSVASDRREQRLDLFAFADLRAGGARDLLGLCEQSANVVGRRHGVLFHADVEPMQRTAALHLVVVVPALEDRPETAEALRCLAEVERWATSTTGYPLLARIWIVSPHTTAGLLTEDGMLTSIAAFALAAVTLRDSEPEMTARLAHLRDGEGRAAFFSVASLAVPEAELRRYAMERAAYDGLSVLVDRTTRKVSDPHLGDQAVAALFDGTWLSAFVDDEAAKRCRAFAASLSSVGAALPEHVSVGPFDDAQTIRTKYASLFQSGVVERDRTQTDSATLEATLSGLDRDECDALASVDRGLAVVLDDTLGPLQGLRRLPEVELGLSRLLAIVDDRLAEDRADVERAPIAGGGATSPAAPALAELEQVTANLPSNGLLLAAAVAPGLGVATLAAMVGIRLATPAAPPAAARFPTTLVAAGPGGLAVAPFAWGSIAPWIVALLVGALAAYVGAFIAGTRSRDRVRELLRERRGELERSRKQGGGGLAQLQADAQLRLRKRRVRRAARTSIERVCERLAVVRRTLLAMHDHSQQMLGDMGVKVRPGGAAGDDLEALAKPAERSHLHGSLVPVRLLADWVARRRTVQNPATWADRLVESCWPQRGLAEDAPCADRERIDTLCREQTAPLEQENMLVDPAIGAAAGEAVKAFTARIVDALAEPCVPRNQSGDRATGLRSGHRFAIAPRAATQYLEPAFGDAINPLWVDSRAARVVFVRTWEGLTIDDVRRGARIAAPDPSPKERS
jgi:hypothetical protein